MAYSPGSQVGTQTATDVHLGRNGTHHQPDVDYTFPYRPPRTDMEIQKHLYKPSYLTAIDLHIQAQGRVAAVRCEEWLNDTSARQDSVAPDLLVAFDVNEEIIESAQRVFHHRDQAGRPIL